MIPLAWCSAVPTIIIMLNGAHHGAARRVADASAHSHAGRGRGWGQSHRPTTRAAARFSTVIHHDLSGFPQPMKGVPVKKFRPVFARARMGISLWIGVCKLWTVLWIRPKKSRERRLIHVKRSGCSRRWDGEMGGVGKRSLTLLCCGVLSLNGDSRFPLPAVDVSPGMGV